MAPVSGYLDLAKNVAEQAAPKGTHEISAERWRRKLEEAGRRGFVVRWGEYPDCIALHDPLSGEWVEVRAEDCFPSLVDEANRTKRTGALQRQVVVRDRSKEKAHNGC